MPQSTPFDAILVQSRDLFRDRLCEAVSGMFDSADESLSNLAEKTTDEEAQKRYLDAKDFVLSRREVMEKQFRSGFMNEFQKRTNQARKIGQTFSDFSMEDLELVGDDDLNETLKFNDMAAKMRRFCEEELSALDQRVGVLLGDAALESDDNPFGPQVISDAYKQASRQGDSTVEQRTVLLKLFDDHVLDTVRSSYKEVNGLLVENSILPKIRYGISKQDNKAPPLATIGEKEKPAEAAEAPSDQDIFSMLAKMRGMGAGAGAGGGAPGAGMGVGGVPQVQGAELMGSLTRLQIGDLSALGDAAAELGPILAEAGNLKNVLHQLKTTSVGGGMGQVDAMTLDIVAMLFDELFDDPKIPIGLKSLIGRLQLPMLKVAIADKELFTKKTHPARQLLDVLGQIGLRLPTDFDASSPLFARLEAFIQELVDGFQEKMEIFDTVRAQLEAIIAEDDQRVAGEMQATERQLQQSENLAVAKAVAQDEIRARVQAANPPRSVVEFLARQWIKYLVIVHARDGKDSEAWKSALATIDQLIASVVPRETPEERRKLPALIPGLLKRLKLGVAAAGIEDSVAAAFFTALMNLHTEIMHAPAMAAPVTAPAAAKKKGKEKAVATPAAAEAMAGPAAPKAAAPAAKPAAKPADDLLDFSAPVSINNPFGEGKVDVSSDDLDFTAASTALAVEAAPPATPEASAAPATPGAAPAAAKRPAAPRAPKPRDTIRLPSAMVVGAWVEVLDADGENRQPAKLHFVSPMKSHFLFVDRKGKKIYECSRSMLARRLKLGEVSLLDGEPDASLFDRIMHGLFGKLGAPAPA
jgi:hypothetical protein